ncbi:MAG: hypothetical protein M3071_07305 [Actinomycetota bacterium]|nr:hypothetical protein [Actinomycetota bacterium]
MTVTPPEAKPEDSRAPSQSKERATISLRLLAGALIGGLLLLVAEFTPLYDQDSAASRIPLHTIHTGSHHAYALIPVALLAISLTVGAARTASRPALLALGALGVVAALVAVLGDLPDATASGFVTGFIKAKDVPQIGLYLETLGAALLVVAGGAGFVLTGAGSAQVAA